MIKKSQELLYEVIERLHLMTLLLVIIKIIETLQLTGSSLLLKQLKFFLELR